MSDSELLGIANGTVVPLFPLSDLVLFPGIVQPLHIFEPRYRQMMDDVLDSSGYLVIGTVLHPDLDAGDLDPLSRGDAPPGGEFSGEGAGPDHGTFDAGGRPSVEPAAVQPLGGLGKVEDYQRLPDGRYVILLRGAARVRLDEVMSERLYRKVVVSLAEETDSSFQEEEACLSRVREATLSRAGVDFSLPSRLSLTEMTDILLLHLKLPPTELYEAFAETSVRRRALNALSLHDERQ